MRAERRTSGQLCAAAWMICGRGTHLNNTPCTQRYPKSTGSIPTAPCEPSLRTVHRRRTLPGSPPDCAHTSAPAGGEKLCESRACSCPLSGCAAAARRLCGAGFPPAAGVRAPSLAPFACPPPLCLVCAQFFPASSCFRSSLPLPYPVCPPPVDGRRNLSRFWCAGWRTLENRKRSNLCSRETGKNGPPEGASGAACCIGLELGTNPSACHALFISKL